MNYMLDSDVCIYLMEEENLSVKQLFPFWKQLKMFYYKNLGQISYF